jgi:sulfate transport system permease protein
MAARAEALPARVSAAPTLAVGVSTLYLSVVVLLPLAALAWHAHGWDAVTSPQAVAALKLTLAASLLVAVINAFAGTAIAWTLVRDRFVGQSFVNALVDLPFALPTIVAGLVLLTLYRDLAFTRWAILAALLFVTFPFVVRTEMEDAAASLGASSFATFRRVILPNILPAILSGVALAFARAIGEFGAVVLISGNLPFKTEVLSVYVFGRIESGDPGGAAAASVAILGITMVVLLGIGGLRRLVTRHDR